METDFDKAYIVMSTSTLVLNMIKTDLKISVQGKVEEFRALFPMQRDFENESYEGSKISRYVARYTQRWQILMMDWPTNCTCYMLL